MIEPVYEDDFERLVLLAFENYMLYVPALAYRDVDCATPYYPDARVLGTYNEYGSTEFIYDKDLIPYEILIRTAAEPEGSYRWVNPTFASARFADMDYDDMVPTRMPAIFGEVWHDTESVIDILDKVAKIMSGRPHDHKVVMVLDISDDTRDHLNYIAERDGISLDEVVEDLLKKTIASLDAKSNP